MLKLKAKDKVRVMLGKDKGREGEIERIIPKKGTAIVVGVNIYKKHVKSFQGQKGGIFELPRPMILGKLMLICPKCNKPTRVGFREVDKERVRICKKCQKQID